MRTVGGHKRSLMRTDLASLEAAIADHRVKLNAWLDSVYDLPHDQREYNGELDCSYECWGQIETTVGAVFDAQLTQSLPPTALESLLFFASRNDEVGCIIAWLGRVGPFSGAGDLTLADFLFLCDAALSRSEDFVDYELVACFHKIPTLSQQQIETVLHFFGRTYAYTKRMAIDVLATKGFDDVAGLARQLWVHDDCEFTKLSALHALKKSSSAPSLLAELLSQFKTDFDISAHDYLQSHIEQLES